MRLSPFSIQIRTNVTIWIDVVIKQAATDLKTRTAALEELKEHSNCVDRDDVHTTPSCVSQHWPHSGVTTLHRLLLISTFTAMSPSPVLHCTQTVPLWWMDGRTFTNGWATIRLHCGLGFYNHLFSGIKSKIWQNWRSLNNIQIYHDS